MPLQTNGLLPSEPQLFGGVVPSGAKHRVPIVNIGFMVAYHTPTSAARYSVGEVTGVTTQHVHARKYIQVKDVVFTETEKQVVLMSADIIHWNFTLTRKRGAAASGNIKKSDQHIIPWDTRLNGMLQCS